MGYPICRTCGACWGDGDFTNGCPECGGGAMTVKCTKCGKEWQRAYMDSNDYGVSCWQDVCCCQQNK